MRRQVGFPGFSLLLSIATVALCFVVAEVLAGSSLWSPAVNISNTVIASYCPRLAADPWGTLHLVWKDWVDMTPHMPYVLYANKPAGGDWSQPTFLPGKIGGDCPALIVDASGALHVAVDRAEGIAYVHHPHGGTWSDVETVADTGEFPDIAMTPDGTLHVAWEDWAGAGTPTQIYHATKGKDGVWSAPVRVSTLAGTFSYPFIATDSQGGVHLVWTVLTTNKFQYAYRAPGKDWTLPTNLPYAPTPWNTVEQLTSGSDGTIHLVRAEMDQSQVPWACRVRHATKRFENPWTAGTPIATDCASHVAVATDPYGRPHVAWNADEKLHWAAGGTAGGWGSKTTVDVDNELVVWDSELSLAVDPMGNRHLTWDFGQGNVWYSSAATWPPVTATITVQGGTLHSATGNTQLDFPAGAVSEDTLVTHTPHGSPPTGDLVAVRFFDLTAERVSDGTPVTQFSLPYTLTFCYLEQELETAAEETLGVYWWDGSQWIAELTDLDTTQNCLAAWPDHMTTFAILGETNRVFLPLVRK